jgi:hypothetical protein
MSKDEINTKFDMCFYLFGNPVGTRVCHGHYQEPQNIIPVQVNPRSHVGPLPTSFRFIFQLKKLYRRKNVHKMKAKLFMFNENKLKRPELNLNETFFGDI